ncbi:DNA polymerase delta small subunit-like [Orussus abietinus]|uniref:DNA polymerase delta small subunit-like n=1 Tax=Orussus abietinus TaxID=222816 RepID=UPI0006250DF9|nr:DNA polymerase delta small subunit-like [Orussus abietinus]
MVLKTDNPAESLLSEPNKGLAQTFERKRLEYKDSSAVFFQESGDFSKQFAHVYSVRLAELRTVLSELVSVKWQKLKITRLADLEKLEHRRCIVIGTLFKHQQWKPSILRELSDEHQLTHQVSRENYCSEDDQAFLEDEMLRVKLVGSCVDIKNIITGVVCAVIGHEKEDGTFLVENFYFPGHIPKSPASYSASQGKLLFISGLDMTTGDNLQLNLLNEWICGMIGDPNSQNKVSSIVRVIIAGNSVRSSAMAHHSKGHMEGRAQDIMFAKEVSDSTKRLDEFLKTIVECCSVTLMPGQHDPTNVMIPQRVLHPCLLPITSRHKNFRGGSNPWIGKVGSRVVMGSSGQPIKDIMKVSGVTSVTALEWLERTLEWRHLCPTAPDTLPSFPYCEKDSFIMNVSPDVYFMGNANKFETKLVTGIENQKTRLVCIPRFYQTKTVILVDMESLDVQPISFGAKL